MLCKELFPEFNTWKISNQKPTATILMVIKEKFWPNCCSRTVVCWPFGCRWLIFCTSIGQCWKAKARSMGNKKAHDFHLFTSSFTNGFITRYSSKDYKSSQNWRIGERRWGGWPESELWGRHCKIFSQNPELVHITTRQLPLCDNLGLCPLSCFIGDFDRTKHSGSPFFISNR